MKQTTESLLIKQGGRIEGTRRYINALMDMISKTESLIETKNKKKLLITHQNGMEYTKSLTNKEAEEWRNNMSLNDLLFEMQNQGIITREFERRITTNKNFKP